MKTHRIHCASIATGNVAPLVGAKITASQQHCPTVSVGRRCRAALIALLLLTATSLRAQVQFTSPRYSVWETGRVAVITVTRGSDGPEAVTVSYTTSDGTATAGQDYTATSGTLTFAPGEMAKSFTIPILDDALPEGAETVRLSLSHLTGPAVFGPNTNAQLTVIDDERSSSPRLHVRPVIAAGGRHTVAIKEDGSLWAWGENNFGQLGIGSEMEHTNTVTRLSADQDWETVAAGSGHTLAIRRDGSLWAWGSNQNGELGVEVEPSVADRSPNQVGTDTDWQMVSAGPGRSFGLKWDGSLWTWGGNWAGSLGLGDDAPIWTNRPTRIGSESDWAWVGSGGAASFAIKLDGSLWAWGFVGYGAAQLGLGDLATGVNVPTRVGLDNEWQRVDSVIFDGQVAVYGPSVAVKSDGSLWSWGHNHSGQLGDSMVAARSSPGRVGDNDDWVAVELGLLHTLALRRDGSLWAWGANGYGVLGLGFDFGNQLEPVRVGSDSDWTAIAAGADCSMALKSDGSLWTWGLNYRGRLGLGFDENQLYSTNLPTRIGMDNDWALPSATPGRGEFRIVAQSINIDHSRTLFFTHTNSRAYYVFYRGDSLTNITQPVDMALASAYPRLTDRTPPATNATAFYRIRAVPRTQPLDLDGDGIDDYYELRHATVLNPLNPDDAAQDYDGDGYSNLAEYRAGYDPTKLDLMGLRHSIASGLGHTVVLKQDGSLWAWGDNTVGQLGDGTYDRRENPVRIGTDNDWVSVSAGRSNVGEDHTVALKRDGSLWAWGANTYGQLGDGTTDSHNVPMGVGNDRSWVEVSAGGGYTAALKRDGSLWFWGNNTASIACCDNSPLQPTQIGWENNWLTIAAGGWHLLALKTDRSLWAWGNNDSGQCGVGDGVFPGNNATQVGSDNDWVAIAASGDADPFNGAHSLGLKADGTLWSWGYDHAGELGLGSSAFSQFTPARVGTDTDWVAITAGVRISVARKRDGSLWMWGSGVGAVPTRASQQHDWRDFCSRGGVGFDGSLWSWRSWIGASRSWTPAQLGSETNWAAITGGGNHSLALKLDGSLWSWGDNSYGQLGDGTFVSTPTPHRIASNRTWRVVSAGAAHSAAIGNDGTLWTWGDNYVGQLGIGSFTTSWPFGLNVPQPVGTNVTWQDVVAGGSHMAALRADGSLWTWGSGAEGDLGNGIFMTNVPYGLASPFAVEPAATWGAVAAGYNNTLALRSDGSLWGCGLNAWGELGLGFSSSDTRGFSTLQRIPTNVAWRTIATGSGYTVAISMDGSLWAWGIYSSGQNGFEFLSATNSPQLVASGRSWKAVVAGGSHTVALESGGALWTWGRNYEGQLGIGTTSPEMRTPQLVQSNITWKAIAVGYFHTLAIREDGTLWSWGYNYYGQSGIIPDLRPLRFGTDTDWGSPP